jgi:hypothetical protein
VCIFCDKRVSGVVVCDVPNKTRIHNRRHNTNRNSLLLRCLSTGRAAPSEDKRVNAIRADGEDDHSSVSARNADGRGSNEETDNGYALGNGNVPCALVEFARGPGDCDCDGASDQVGWAC